MKEPKFKVEQRVRIGAGEFAGQEGVVYLIFQPFTRYLVMVEHEGFPEKHRHHIKVEEKDLEVL